ncbi:CLUMA_CG020499, isoform A [Clunio marinus]|uniref:CLUMA_CG020499, isoform A n=1 Tax=Clunio marinus TaxID=568069 RepID=A0A1J1J7T4_9DIPT|nr:CLUMA_CG020499, isoform A [Clunio marinus]
MKMMLSHFYVLYYPILRLKCNSSDDKILKHASGSSTTCPVHYHHHLHKQLMSQPHALCVKTTAQKFVTILTSSLPHHNNFPYGFHSLNDFITR